MTEVGLSFIHCFKIHLLARSWSLSHSLKSDLLRDSVLEGKLSMTRPGYFLVLYYSKILRSRDTEIVNVCPSVSLTFKTKRRGLVIHFIKYKGSYVESVEFFILSFSHSVADKSGSGRSYCFLQVILSIFITKTALPFLCDLVYIWEVYRIEQWVGMWKNMFCISLLQ